MYLYRLMGQVIREDDQAAGRVGEATRSAIRVVNCVETDDDSDYTTTRTIIMELGAHLAVVRTQDHSAVLWASPEFLAVTCRTAEQANDLRDPSTAVALASRNNLAYAYQSAGDMGRAVPLYEQALADQVRVLGPNHPDTKKVQALLRMCVVKHPQER